MEKIQSLIIIFCDFWKKNILFENHHFWFNVIHYKSHKDQKWTRNAILLCRFGQNDILLSKSPSPGNSMGKISDSPFSPFPGEKNSHGEMEPLVAIVAKNRKSRNLCCPVFVVSFFTTGTLISFVSLLTHACTICLSYCCTSRITFTNWKQNENRNK